MKRDITLVGVGELSNCDRAWVSIYFNSAPSVPDSLRVEPVRRQDEREKGQRGNVPGCCSCKVQLVRDAALNAGSEAADGLTSKQRREESLRRYEGQGGMEQRFSSTIDARYSSEGRSETEHGLASR